ncbi:MAG: GatB/YqeY domain-containing protein, partial [Fulvivirga sp.]
EELTVLRAIKSAILLAETEKGAGEGLESEAEMKLLAKQAKQRKDSADIYAKEGRDDLASKELFELEIINRYLPKQLSETEIEEIVKGIISKVGASGRQDMGKVMGSASKEMSGKADGKKISEIVKKLLSN